MIIIEKPRHTTFIIQWFSLIRWCCLSLLFVAATSAYANTATTTNKGNIGFDTFKLQAIDERVYMVNGQLKYELSDYLFESLHNGITLRSEVDVNLGKERQLWWNGTTSLATIKASLSYHALSQHYRIIQDNNEEHWNFRSLRSALKKLGEIRGFRLPILPKDIDSGDYSITVSARLTPESLSFPMHIESLFVDKYALKTSGVVWPLP
ncbi:MAG TPA: DUF4390 domain-containing protein [Thiothrix sp.]|nr:DUF4390 domain-containing protein [Thiothrix sp.]